VVKGRELSGVSGVLFVRNSITGRVEALPRAGGVVELNADLHSND
jgi:2,3,4,5-tetrahydropyridine-2-carboxylate N-succinyltransferase